MLLIECFCFWGDLLVMIMLFCEMLFMLWVGVGRVGVEVMVDMEVVMLVMVLEEVFGEFCEGF